MAINKITLKKVVVGTPIKTVTAGSFGINNLGGVTTCLLYTSPSPRD